MSTWITVVSISNNKGEGIIQNLVGSSRCRVLVALNKRGAKGEIWANEKSARTSSVWNALTS